MFKNMYVENITSNRTLSSFPLSVGTGLAFESLFTPTLERIDNERVIPEKVDLGEFNEVWVNLFTLYRNIFQSLVKEDIPKLTPRAMIETIHQEMEVIKSLFANTSVTLKFYICTYKGFDKKFPHALLRVPSTEGQRWYFDLFKVVEKAFIDMDKSLVVFDYHPTKSADTDVLFFTHVAFDLTSFKSFKSLKLLESHTGVLKDRSVWYTKFQNGKELNMIPFTLYFLEFFGDSVHFKPFPFKARNTILEVAKNKHWTQITTRDKILSNIKEINDYVLRDVLVDMMKIS